MNRITSLVVAGVLSGVIAAAAAQTPEPRGDAAIAQSILWGVPMAPLERTAGLPRDVADRLAEYRQREQLFHTALKAPPGATPLERALFEKRVGIERVVFCLFPRRDIVKVAASFASDIEVSDEWDGTSEPPRREAAFIDSLFQDLQQTWLTPYLNLVSGHRKLCASQLEGSETAAARKAMADEGRRQLARARESSLPLIRAAAGHVLSTGKCKE